MNRIQHKGKIMSTYEKKQLEKSFSIFTKKHFERPSRCKTVAQVQFYINELVGKIEELKFKFNYVPSVAYTLLTQYNTAHNSMVLTNFTEIYKPIKW